MNKTAFITGLRVKMDHILAEFLLEKGYIVHGLVRRSSSFNTQRIDHIINNENYSQKFFFHHGDLTDATSVRTLIEKVEPDEIYNLAAQSHVKVSFEIPDYTTQVDALGTLRFLEAIRHIDKSIKFYQASTSELYGKVQEIPQKETTKFYPRSPYAVAKLYAYWMIINYREAYNVFGCNGILFNHESPRRGATFVTKKITKAACKIKKGIQECLMVGNLNAKRDWGYAPEYCEGMWMILQQEQPEDFILATGKTYSVRQFIEFAFKELEIEIDWIGEGENEIGKDASSGKTIVKVDPRYYRPTEVDLLVGDFSKAKKILGWEPKTELLELVQIMVKSDWEELNKGSKY